MTSRRLDLDVVTTGDTSGLTRTASGLDLVARAIDGVGDQARQSSDSVDDLGDELRGAAASAGMLDAALDATRERHAALMRQFDSSGDVELLPGIRGEASSLRSLTRIRAELDRLTPETRGIGASLMQGMSSALSSLPGVVGGAISATGPAGAAVAVVVGASIATAMGAAISGGLLGAAGAGAIAIGIKGAASDPGVKEAAAGLKETISGELTQIGANFTGPLIAAMGTIRSRTRDLGLADAFAPLARTIGPITDGLMGMVENALPGLKKALAASGPFIEAIADALPGLGTSIGDFASSLAKAGPGAAKFFQLLIEWGGGAIEVVGEVVEALAKAYDFVATLLEKVGVYDFKKGADDTAASTTNLGNQTAAAGADMTALAEATAKATAELDALKQKTDTAWGAQMGLDQATLQLSEGMRQLAAGVRDNGVSLQEGTEKGNANREMLLGLIGNAYSLYQAELAAGASVQTASGHLWANLGVLETNAKKAGFNADQVRALLNAYVALSMSPDINKQVNIHYRKIGDTGPISNSYADIPTGRIGGYAAGGWTRPGPIMVGEQGPELRWEDKPGWISTAAETARMLTGGGRRATPVSLATPTGGGQVPQLILRSDGSRLADLLVELLRQAVEQGGGNVQDVLGTRGA